MHLTVLEQNEVMKRRLNRVNYITPTNYIELVDGYRELLKNKRKEVNDNRSKLITGLEKLAEAEE
jgi:dynein heavy chain